MNGMKRLEGRTILSLSVSRGEAALLFVTNHGPVVYSTEGDCCSESWWADVIGVDALIGQTIETADEITLPSPLDNERSRQESDAQYGYRLQTNLGHCDLIFRNSSNGYYGGWLRDESLESPDNLDEFRQITESDWSA